jgi:4-amino-4-deoxy-L-arabinose transferase-like glycosyltransferase
MEVSDSFTIQSLRTADLRFVQGKRARWLVLMLIASLPLVGWWAYGLFDLDEGFYAAVTGSMIRHAEWITPLYNGKPWFEKPILIYWLAKPAIMLFGQAVGPRLPSVLATIGTYAIVAWFVRRRIGAMAAVMSMIILGSSLLVVIVGRMMMTDAPLLFFFTAAMLAYWESLVGNPKWKLVTAACLGIAVLAKGPVAIILFVLIASWTAFANRGSRISDRGSDRQNSVLTWALGVVVLFAIIATWYVPAYVANGQVFVQKFLIDQNVGRFTGGDQAHTLPLWKSFWFYIPVLLLGMFPWILFLPAVIKGRSEVRDPSSEMLWRYLFGWATIIFIFFTISGAKLPHYVLPCCPPIAILVGWYLSEKWKSLERNQIRPKLMLTIGWLATCWIIAQLGFEYWYVRSGQQDAHAIVKWIPFPFSRGGIIEYQLPRRNEDRGTGRTELQETSLPSLSFYLNRDVIESNKFSDIQNAPLDAWIITRRGRISPEEAWNMPDGKHLKSMSMNNHFEKFVVEHQP